MEKQYSMKKYFILFTVALFIGFISCSKDNDVPTDNPIEKPDNGDANTNPEEVENPDRSKTPSFPGAEGGGMYTLGGAGGKVYKVTSLEDGYGKKGTLRYAVEQREPRTIVFEVSGNIKLITKLNINYGDITIAGQTAPGEGITITNHPVTVNADNVIIRFIRFRMGDEKALEDDAIGGRFKKNIIIDHCSMSWGTDECASFYANDNFTMQWSLIAESLNRSVHQKGDHGYGGLWGGYNASFHNNLVAHHKSRNPRFYGVRDEVTRERAEMINNVIYNWGDNSSYGGEEGEYNIINNYYKAGPGTKYHKNRIFEPYKKDSYGTFFIEGNYVDGYPSITSNNWLGVSLKSGGDINSIKAEKPFDIYPVEIKPAEEAYKNVLKHVGVSTHRDAIDSRIIEEVRTGTATYGGVWGEKTGIIDSQTDVGGWPEIKSDDAPIDTDGDGMPDTWETKKGLNPNDASDGNKYSLSKEYTNLEVYLNQLVSDKIGFGK